MPWKECHVMDERLRFVARLAEINAPINVLGFGVSEADNSAGVGCGLQQGGYEPIFIGSDDGGSRFTGEVGREPARDHISEAMPPSGFPHRTEWGECSQGWRRSR